MAYALKCLGRCEKEKDNETASEGRAKWTVLAYVCGTDLETEGGYATYNIEEIAQTTPNDSVNVVIQTGFIILAIHAVLMLIICKILKLDLFTAGVASLANIGGYL